ncbi:alpha/beta hydrolase [Naasia lichenicola]|uniref:Alpha/beta hydrolase n=1 Tax=Naasia lichenicola TaxID=2565933 RepID=A0A4S4FM84_9MICO|nr:alpha/beta hydrolase [Naasia lichenicola]THG31509.1 alpha/beta hydrolase [Naasia lichenicola]
MEPLAPGMQRIGAVMRRLPGSSVATATDAQIARSSGAAAPELLASILMGSRPKGISTEDRRTNGIPIRIYRPDHSRASRPLIVYFHGGGFVFGDLRGGDWIAGTVAKQLDAVVVSVDYRLAPKHPFPAAVDDCFAGLVWAADHAAELGADAQKIGVMGESAGGNLAAVVALLARDASTPLVSHQALLYPATGVEESASRLQNAEAVILTAADMKRFGELYGGDASDWRVSPIRATSLAGLPPAVIVVASHDPLRDDGVQYAAALKQAGVQVSLTEYPAMPHGFLNFPRFARDAVPALKRVVFHQRRTFGWQPS